MDLLTVRRQLCMGGEKEHATRQFMHVLHRHRHNVRPVAALASEEHPHINHTPSHSERTPGSFSSPIIPIVFHLWGVNELHLQRSGSPSRPSDRLLEEEQTPGRSLVPIETNNPPDRTLSGDLAGVKGGVASVQTWSIE